jgi:hypothetical protein
MVPKYVAATSQTSATFPTALDNCSVIAMLILGSMGLSSLKMEGIGNFGEEMRSGRDLTIAREPGEEVDELDGLRTP